MGFFEIGLVGLPCALLGAAYLLTIGRRLLPDRKDLIEQLEATRREYLVEMLVQPGCRLAGKTVADAGLRHLPGLFLIEIDRDGEVIGPVGPDEPIQANDRLVFTGVVETIVDLEKIPGLVPAADAPVRGLARDAAGPAALRGGDQPQLAAGRPGGARRRLPRALRRGHRRRAPQRRPGDQQGRRHPPPRRRHAADPGRAVLQPGLPQQPRLLPGQRRRGLQPRPLRPGPARRDHLPGHDRGVRQRPGGHHAGRDARPPAPWSSSAASRPPRRGSRSTCPCWSPSPRRSASARRWSSRAWPGSSPACWSRGRAPGARPPRWRRSTSARWSSTS